MESLIVNGEEWKPGGYPDVGIADTMKDLLVNFIGAAVFSAAGIFYLKQKGKGKPAAFLIQAVKDKKRRRKIKTAQMKLLLTASVQSSDSLQ